MPANSPIVLASNTITILVDNNTIFISPFKRLHQVTNCILQNERNAPIFTRTSEFSVTHTVAYLKVYSKDDILGGYIDFLFRLISFCMVIELFAEI